MLGHSGLFVFHGFAREQQLGSPLLGQILPPWISSFNQSNFLAPQPSLQFFLSSDSAVNIVEALVVDQAVAVIFAGKALDVSALMLERSTVDAVGHTDVEGARVTGHDVDEIFVVSHELNSARSRGERLDAPEALSA